MSLLCRIGMDKSEPDIIHRTCVAVISLVALLMVEM